MIAALSLCALVARAATLSIDATSSAADLPPLAVGDTVSLSLTDGLSPLALTIVSESHGFGGMRVYSARIGDGPLASSVLVSGDAVYIEARDLDSGVLHKVAVRNGETTVESVDLSKTSHGECIEVETPVETEEPTKAVRTRLMASNPFDDVVVAPAPVTIDMMLVFENGAREWIATQAAYGGSITNFAVMQIAKMNQVLENTGLHTNFWFRLVDIMSVDARVTAITADSTTTLKNGADSGEGPYGEVKTRRDACGADCVSLIVDTGKNYGTTGIGYTTKGTNAEGWATRFREWCYSVCAVRSVADSYTLSHEVGHNMGLTHSRTLNGWGKATFEYANGYNFTDSSGKKYHTIMAYDHDHPPDGNGTMVGGYAETPYYSSPDYSLADGTPVGSETANATLALRKTCSYIARWRDTKIPMPSDVLFSVAPTTAFIQPLEVELCNLGNFPMHYTLDGTEPTPASPLYSGPLTLTTATTVKAVAVVDENNTMGAVSTASYSPAVEAASYLKLSTPSASWKNGGWRDESGGTFSGSLFFMANDKVAFLMPGCDIEVDTVVNLDTLVLAGETPFRVTTSRSLAASTLDVVGAATLSGLSYAFANWKLHPGSSLVLAPGAGQTLTYTNNVAVSDATASLVVSNGTVSVSTAGSNYGCFGNATLRIASGGTLVIGGDGWKTGYLNSSPFIIDSNATMRVDSVESIHRPLTLAGGAIDINRNGRAVDFNDLSISVTDGSEVKATNPNGYVVIRNSDVSIDVASEKELLVSAEIRDGGNGLQSNGRGIVKNGDGTIRFTREPRHSGATTINAGTVAVGFSSTSASGTGWMVKSGAALSIEECCSLSVPSLTLESGAALAVPAAVSAPLTATNEVNLSGVCLSLDGASDLSEGKSYPILSSTGGFTGVSGVVADGLPEVADGLMWKVEVDDGTLYAKVIRNVVNIPDGETVNLSDIPSTVVSVTGEGTLLCNGSDLTTAKLAALRGYVANNGWMGTVAFTNYAATTLALDFYGGTISTVRLTGVSGYPGANGNTNIYFHTTIELIDGADGTPAWTLNNGYSSDCAFIDRLKGDGTLKSTLSPNSTYVRQGIVVADASGFTGSLDLVGTQFTFGSTKRNNDTAQNGTIYIDAGCSVTNSALWKAANLVVNGELVKNGTLTFADSVVFGNGASLVVDSLPAGGVVLTSRTITTNGVLSVGVIGDSRPYVVALVDNGDSTVSLVFEKAPLPETVRASITVLNGDWEEDTFDFDLPTAWITNYYPTLETISAVAAKYDEDAANGAKVWQCYMLGLDPTDASSGVSLAMTVESGKIRFAVEGLGETHELAGINVYWYMKTSTNLVTDASFSKTRDSAQGLPPTFGVHDMPDKPTGKTTEPVADALFYKISVLFVAEDGD